MNIKHAGNQEEKRELDQLLWDVLWKPLGFPRDIRKQFNLENPRIELVAVDGKSLIAGLVAYYLSDSEVEIRHIAVKPDIQNKAVGRRLVDSLISLFSGKSVNRIIVYARSTSEGFYARCGFKPVGEKFKHKLFAEHGIDIQPMHLDL